jgi:hypothetical protein
MAPNFLFFLFQYLGLLLLVGVATALPVGDSEPEARELPPSKRQAPYGPPPPVYKPAPAPYKPAPAPYKAPHPEAKLPPQPYQFEYGVADQYTGTNFQAVENQDEKGTVIGSYRVNLPDGRVQTVTYTADHYGGFVADVKYEGEAQYPPEKEYKPAPAPYKAAPPKYAPA